jgi:hypothetical protein
VSTVTAPSVGDAASVCDGSENMLSMYDLESSSVFDEDEEDRRYDAIVNPSAPLPQPSLAQSFLFQERGQKQTQRERGGGGASEVTTTLCASPVALAWAALTYFADGARYYPDLMTTSTKADVRGVAFGMADGTRCGRRSLCSVPTAVGTKAVGPCERATGAPTKPSAAGQAWPRGGACESNPRPSRRRRRHPVRQDHGAAPERRPWHVGAVDAGARGGAGHDRAPRTRAGCLLEAELAWASNSRAALHSDAPLCVGDNIIQTII